MFPIILSDENWRVGKASLHAALPVVRSSHLAEAIAAGLGARQHASIVPKLRRMCSPREFIRVNPQQPECPIKRGQDHLRGAAKKPDTPLRT